MISNIKSNIASAAGWCSGWNNLQSIKKVLNGTYYFHTEDNQYPTMTQKVVQVASECFKIYIKMSVIAGLVRVPLMDYGYTTPFARNSINGLVERAAIVPYCTVRNNYFEENEFCWNQLHDRTQWFRSEWMSQQAIIDSKPRLPAPALVIPPPVIEKPIVRKPVAHQPVIEQPIFQKPIIPPPVVEQPIIQKPINSPPVVKQPIIQKPISSPNKDILAELLSGKTIEIDASLFTFKNYLYAIGVIQSSMIFLELELGLKSKKLGSVALAAVKSLAALYVNGFAYAYPEKVTPIIFSLSIDAIEKIDQFPRDLAIIFSLSMDPIDKIKSYLRNAVVHIGRVALPIFAYMHPSELSPLLYYSLSKVIAIVPSSTSKTSKITSLASAALVYMYPSIITPRTYMCIWAGTGLLNSNSIKNKAIGVALLAVTCFSITSVQGV